MTTVMTRLYADEETARRIERRLYLQGFPRRATEVIAKREGQGASALADRMTTAHVPEAAAGTYAEKVATGKALLVVRATYKPLGAPRIARETLADSPVVKSGLDEEEFYVDTGPERSPSILTDHPHFLTFPREEAEMRPDLISASLGIPLISRKGPKSTVYKGGRLMSKMFWPMPMVIRKKSADSVIHGGRHVSKLFWPMPLVTDKPRRNSVIRGGDLPFSRVFALPTILRR